MKKKLKTPRGWVLIKEGEIIPKKYRTWDSGCGTWTEPRSVFSGCVWDGEIFAPMIRRKPAKRKAKKP